MLTAALAVGCASTTTPAASPTRAAIATAAATKSPAPLAIATSLPRIAGPSAATTTGVPQNLNGAHVSVLGLWSGPELEPFMTVKAAWEKDSGGIVDWEGTQDLPKVLSARLQAGNPPDIAILPNPGLMQQLAKEGNLVALNSFMDMDQVRKDYSPAWIDLGSYKGNLYAIFYKAANKATVWYNPKAFAAAGYTVPKTWNDMLRLAAHRLDCGDRAQ